jgi:type II secretory pathway pseudopilin PulG
MKWHFGNGRLLAWLAAIVAIAAVATSIWLNPPSEMRARRFDQLRAQGLNQTQNAIQMYYAVHDTLPVDLKALESEHNLHQEVNWRDPETQQPFEYAIMGESSYRLCAIFSRNSDRNDETGGFIYGKHSAGRDCFQENVVHYPKQ